MDAIAIRAARPEDGEATPADGGARLAAAPGVGLAPLAVRHPFQRRGIGARLVEGGLAACSCAGLAFVVVLGEPRYYSRFGFRRARAQLRPGALAGVSGVVRYAAEFAAVVAR